MSPTSRSGTPSKAPEPSALDALQAIADLPAGKTEDVMKGQEQAYRAVEALFAEKPFIAQTAKEVVE